MANKKTYLPTVTIERTFRAPVERVWAMWTTKAGLEKWYWPAGMDAIVIALDVRVGGGFEIGSPGFPLTSRGTYTAVVPNERLELTAAVDFVADVEPYERHDVIEFHAVPGGTKMVFTSTRMHDDVWQGRATVGFSQSLDKLERALAES
jgi:uncharacterized protein YndB with AHSA1/START domain